MRISNLNSLKISSIIERLDGDMTRTMERISTGLRIAHPSDDPAGFAIAERMRNQIKGLHAARKNTLDAISLLQVAEGGLNETHSILSRIRELTIQAANGTLSDDDRLTIQTEINELAKGIDSISDDTEFNTIKLLNGNISTNAKKATFFNTSGNAIESVSANSVTLPGTYNIKFSNIAASKAMESILYTGALEGEYALNSSGVANVNSGFKLASSLTQGNTYFNSAVKTGTFFINNTQITIENSDTIYSLLNKINNSDSGVGATVDQTNGSIMFVAGSSEAAGISLASGTSDFLAKAGFLEGTAGWASSSSLVNNASDNHYLTGSTAGSVKLTELEAAGNNDQNIGLQQTDIINISGKIGGQEYTQSLAVGNNSLGDLLTTIGNTFSGATANIERQRATLAATGPLSSDFNEGLTLQEAFGATSNGDIIINGVTIGGTGYTFDGSTTTLGSFVDMVNSYSLQTGVGASLDGDAKKITFSSANNITMDISSSTGSLANTLGIVKVDGSTFDGSNDENRLVVRGQDGAVHAVTDLKITATDQSGNSSRAVFNAAFSFTQMQAARDKGDYLAVAEQNFASYASAIPQAYAQAVKPGSINKELIPGVELQISEDVSGKRSGLDEAIVNVSRVDGSLNIQTGANKGQSLGIAINDMGTMALGLRESSGSLKIDVTDYDSAQQSLERVDKAIKKVSSERASIGAEQNRLEHRMSILAVQEENLAAAESRISDADIAAEMANFVKMQILMQVAFAVQAQANQISKNVLSLLN